MIFSKKNTTSIIVDCFNIEYKNKIICGKCAYEHEKNENSFFMAIPLFPDENGNYELIKCLQKLFEKEKIEMKCPKCQNDSLSKQTTILKYPKTLIFHLQRFLFCGKTFKKLTTEINFPLNLHNLSEFSESKVKVPNYELYAVCNHYGSRNEGHYWAYVKYLDRWFDADDLSVKEVDKSKIEKNTACILFYESKS